MKFIFLSTLSLIAADQVMNGWSVNCRVSTGKPAFMASVETQAGTDLYWSAFSTKTFNQQYANIAGAGPLDPNSDNFCDETFNSTDVLIIDESIVWPNDVKPVPQDVFGQGYISIALGFASPNNAYDGCVAIANMNQPSKSSFPINNNDMQIITGGCGFEKHGDPMYYYQMAKWFDMDNDGDLDMITARSESQTNPLVLTSSDLVWLENQGQPFEAGNNAWKTHTIQAAHDITDSWLDVWSDGTNIYIVTGGLASRKLLLVQSPDFSDENSIKATVIDNDGRYFYEAFEDMNLDGIQDLVITIGSYGEQYGMLVFYPGQINNGIWSPGPKVVVNHQFPNLKSKGTGSPGFGYRFWYNTQDQEAGKLPSLMLSGQNDGMMYMVDPVGDVDSFNFEYNVTTIYVTKEIKDGDRYTPANAPTVAQPLMMDINGDGCTEIIVAGYFIDQIVVLEQDACI